MPRELTGSRRTATVREETPVDVLWLSTSDLKEIMYDAPQLDQRLWETAGGRYAQNFLIGKQPFNQWDQLRLRRWLLKASLHSPENNVLKRLNGPVLLGGEAIVGETGVTILKAPVVHWISESAINTPRTFRRSCATELIRNNADLDRVKKLLGHASAEPLKPYTKLTIVDLKKVDAECHPRERDDRKRKFERSYSTLQNR